MNFVVVGVFLLGFFGVGWGLLVVVVLGGEFLLLFLFFFCLCTVIV